MSPQYTQHRYSVKFRFPLFVLQKPQMPQKSRKNTKKKFFHFCVRWIFSVPSIRGHTAPDDLFVQRVHKDRPCKIQTPCFCSRRSRRRRQLERRDHRFDVVADGLWSADRTLRCMRCSSIGLQYATVMPTKRHICQGAAWVLSTPGRSAMLSVYFGETITTMGCL